jgi:hypothetical protein
MALNIWEYDKLMNQIQLISKVREEIAKKLPPSGTHHKDLISKYAVVELTSKELNDYINTLGDAELELRGMIRKLTDGLPSCQSEGSNAFSPRNNTRKRNK